MSIHLDCPICDQRLNIPNKAVGRLIQCVACGSAIRVPDPKAMVATEEVEPAGLFGGLRLSELGARSSDFISRRPLAALGILLGLLGALIAFKFAKAAISSNLAETVAVESQGPVDPEPWEGVSQTDQNERVCVTAKAATDQLIDVVRPSVGVKRKTSKVYTKIVLEIKNLAPETIEYSGWGLDPKHQDHLATMKDNTGGEHRQPAWADVIIGQVGTAKIEPNSSIEETLVFDLSPSYVKYLKLALPAKAVGGTGILRIKIPRRSEAAPD